jgi:conjugative relaxase-like TrwC/TraI family protein
MFTVSQVHNIGYCLNTASSEYYTKGGEPEGKWIGSAVHLLGLNEKITKTEFENIMQGYSPNKQFSLTQSQQENRQFGWDFTFSAPKSVSCLWAAADSKLQKQIENAQQAAVSKVFNFIERDIIKSRRGKCGERKENVMAILGGTFSHCTSREQDPQLHTHCIIPNVAARFDGTWGTIESKKIYFWQKTFSVFYRSELANELQKLGLTIEVENDAFKLRGVPEKVCENFSKRGIAIKKELRVHGLNSTASPKGDVITLATRASKKEVHRPSLFNQWNKEFVELGINKKNILNNALSKAKSVQVKQLSNEQVLDLLTITKSTFRKQDLLFEVGKQKQSMGESINAIVSSANKIIDNKIIVELGEDQHGNTLYSTTKIIDKERQLIDIAKELSSSSKFKVSESVINNVISKEVFTYSAEQVAAIHHAGSAGSLAIIQGSAGGGKSTLLNSVSKAYEYKGFNVYGAAVAKSASKNLEAETGIKSFTLSMLEVELKKKSDLLGENSILIIDEAGQLGTNSMHWLLRTARIKGFKLILVGEDKQLEAIEQGGSLKYLSKSDIIGTARVESIRRQKDSWARIAVALLRDGKASLALSQFYKQKKLSFYKCTDSAKDNLVSNWFRNNNKVDNKIILAQKWADVIDINKRIRHRLIESGEISKVGTCFDSTINNKVFQSEVSVGDKVRLTKNNYSLGFTNGDIGIVKSINAKGIVDSIIKLELSCGKVINVDTDEYCNEQGQVYLVHAYAMTVYSSQGLTVKGDSFVYYTKGMDRANSYVACSRHTDNCHLFVADNELTDSTYTNDKERLFSLSQLMSRDPHNGLAIEHFKERSIAKNKELEGSELGFP